MDLKILNSSNFFLLTIIFLFLSLAGIPPLVGFIGKFLMLILFFNQNYFLFIILFFLLNLFMIYFYIQNLRFLWRKTKLLNSTVFLSFSSSYLFNFKVNNIYCDKCWTGYGVIKKHKRIKGKHGKWAFFVWQG